MALILDEGYEGWVHAAWTFRVYPITLPAGRALSDWPTFLLTWREDPRWPRTSFQQRDNTLDPYDTWDVVLSLERSAADAIQEAGAALWFPMTPTLTALGAGTKRYAFDVRAGPGTSTEFPLVKATFLT